jgi:hypothetical protein
MAVRIVGGGLNPSQGLNDIVAAALIANVEFFALATAYQEELVSTVFPLRAIDPAKTRRAHQRILASLNTLPVLQFIWKESPSMADAALAPAGVRRLDHGGPLTVHGLTTLLHTGESSVTAAVKRVGRIVRAGEAYGLIETHRIREKMIEIVGTELLHALMLRAYVGRSLKLPPPADDDDPKETE